MKVARLRELFLWLSTCYTIRQNTHYEGTRVQVNIHVIAIKQLLGKIRSVITGLKIKWEFFISDATCYSTNRGERGTLMRVDSEQMGGQLQRTSRLRPKLNEASTLLCQLLIPNNI